MMLVLERREGKGGYIAVRMCLIMVVVDDGDEGSTIHYLVNGEMRFLKARDAFMDISKRMNVLQGEADAE